MSGRLNLSAQPEMLEAIQWPVTREPHRQLRQANTTEPHLFLTFPSLRRIVENMTEANKENCNFYLNRENGGNDGGKDSLMVMDVNGETKGYSIECMEQLFKRDRSESELEILREPESHVMLLYTGGTIGMRCEDGVYAPAARYLPSAIRALPNIHDQDYVDRCYKGYHFQPNCLPKVAGQERRIIYWVFEYQPVLDSCDVTFDDWIRIAKDIITNYQRFDGFVVLHGTDTMAYTASALSFLFEHLGKPIVLTGSQIPLCEVRSDGRENLIGALMIAGHYNIPEVCLFFDSKLFRGNRSTKTDNASLEAFASPNLQPLARLGIHIDVNYESIFRSGALEKCRIHTNLCRDVAILRIYPSISIDCVRAFLGGSIKGVVLQTFGAGNIPLNRTDVIEEIKAATKRGILILNSSQCLKGSVSTLYKTGAILQSAGVIAGGDMTSEAALVKLAYVLGKDDWNAQTKREMLGKNLRGEMTVVHNRYSNQEASGDYSFESDSNFLGSFSKLMKLSSGDEVKLLKQSLLPPLLCQAAGAGDLKMLHDLRNHLGATMAERDYDNRSPLHVAAACGHSEVVRELLANGASVHAKDRSNETPLMSAIRNNSYECIKLMIRSGAHLKMPRVALGMELCVCAYQGDVERLRAFKLAGAALDTGDYDHRTALHIAAARGKRDVVEFLLQEGDVDPTVVDNFGNMPIDEAKKYRNEDLTRVLTKHAADLKDSELKSFF